MAFPDANPQMTFSHQLGTQNAKVFQRQQLALVPGSKGEKQVEFGE